MSFAGALTGFVVGMTGVGGGALMTPILLFLFGTAPLTAVGTDLWFAAITKLAVSGLHLRSKVIDWPIVARLWVGSLPMSLLTVAWIASRPADPGVVVMVRGAIGVAIVPVGPQPPVPVASQAECRSRPDRCRGRLRTLRRSSLETWDGKGPLTVATGALLGVLVTLTSVGAGALGAVCLYHLYPRRLTPARLVATDIAHAIPLALCAGVGHLAVSHVDGSLLRDLLAGLDPRRAGRRGLVGTSAACVPAHCPGRDAAGGGAADAGGRDPLIPGDPVAVLSDRTAPFSGLFDHHHLGQRLPRDVRHLRIVSGIPDRDEDERALVPGRSSTSPRNPIGLGVWVRVARPA